MMMFLLLHIIGCLFAVAGNISKSFYMTSWIESNNLHEKSVSQKYLAALYWALVSILTVGYGDILPQNPIEIAVSIILYFIGVAIYSYIISRLINIFSNVNKVNSEEQSNEVVINKFIKEKTFSDHLIKKIQYFFNIENEENRIFLSK